MALLNSLYNDNSSANLFQFGCINLKRKWRTLWAEGNNGAFGYRKTPVAYILITI